jgi:hypothetical protein
MAYQSGTFTNLNDVLSTFATFLVSVGWTLHSNFREPMMFGVPDHRTTPPPPHDVYSFRYAWRVSASKGNKFIAMQDFYITHDGTYGTSGGGFPINGPGIAAVIGTAAGATVTEADMATAHPSWYHGMPAIMNPEGPVTLVSFVGDVTNPSTNFIMPLPSVVGQDNGTWSTGDFLFVQDNILAAPFGPVSGVPAPAPYWMMSDAGGDNVMLVVLHDNTTTLKTTYLGFGDMVKAGAWAGLGTYMLASHCNTNAFTGDVSGHGINNFGPPASVMNDTGITLAVRCDVDTDVNNWAKLGLGGRRLSSSAVIEQGLPGLQGGQFQFGTLRTLQSSLVNGATGLPLYIVVLRDSGLWSLVGNIPNVFQAKTAGFTPGTNTLAGDGTAMVVFDGFTVRKFP